MKKKTVIEMEYGELETLVKEALGQPFEFVPDQEASNDSTHSFSVDGSDPDDYDQKKVDEFIKHGKWSNWLALPLMNTLCKMGKLEKGEYLVNVCW